MKSPDKGWWYATSGAAVGKVSEKWDSTGAVVQYGYDANGRQISITYPNRSEVVTTSYAPVDPADQILLNDTRPRTVTRTINAIEVERTYYAYLPTQEIVERCGYSDVSSFRKLFKRATTLTPADYRERFRLRPH